MKQKEKWNEIHLRCIQSNQKLQVAWVLDTFQHLLPDSGTALDLACGLGGNALRLAESGLETHGWDISDVAVQNLSSQAADKSLPLFAEVRDVALNPPAPASFDVLVVANYLQRSIFPALKASLRPRGLVFYQTFTHTRPENFSGPSNPDFLLKDNELLQLFSGWNILQYREDQLIGNLGQGRRGVAAIVVQKPL